MKNKLITLILLLPILFSSYVTFAQSQNVSFNDSSNKCSNNQPEVNKVYDTDSTVSGFADKNVFINVYNENKILIGQSFSDSTGNYCVEILKNYLPLKVNQVLFVTQNRGILESNPTILTVQHKKSNDYSAEFRTGYWNDDFSYLAINGEFSSSALDFDKKSNTNFSLYLKSYKKVIKLSVPCVTTDFNSPETYDGYQALIRSEDMESNLILPDGSYGIYIQAVNIKGVEESPLKATNPCNGYIPHHSWNEMGNHNVGNRLVSFSTSPDGVAMINLLTLR